MRRQASRAAQAVLVLIAFALAPTAVARQAPSTAPQRIDLHDRLPFDQAVHTARLANGLTYYVRQNGRPEHRVSLRLAVKAGSLEEADDERGLAHFIEHMAFNGSAHFKPGELVAAFEKVGARLGPHVNAYTSFDETVYMLDLPADDPEVVRKGLTALADFAGGLTLDPSEVDKERGVVIEEWRGGLGAGSRIRDRQIPILYQRSRYAERLPIGKPDIIRTAPVARLRAFYDTWYRPDRMAVVVVGDVSPASIESGIRALFGPLAPRGRAARPPDGTVPISKQHVVSVLTDPEVTQSSVQIIRKRPREPEERVADYRRDLVERLVQDMFNERFGELVRKADAKFLGAGASGGGLGRTVETFSVSARVADGQIAEGLEAIALEVQRVRQFGFSPSELDRARKWLMAAYERAYAERDKSESGGFAQEYVNHFLNGEPAPGIAYEYELAKAVLPGITVAEANAMARRLLADDNTTVLAVAPERVSAPAPSERDLRAALARAASEPLEAWRDAAAAGVFLADRPKPAEIRSRREMPEIGVTVVQFANGVEAWLKPTDFKNDQVVFELETAGGSSLAPPSEYVEAVLSDSYVERSGVGGVKAQDLEKLLAGKVASAAPFISLSTHGVTGSAAPADLETALQLLYADVTAPGDDPEAFAVLKRQLAASIANREQSPGRVFSDRLAQINTCNHYTAQPLTGDRIAALDRRKMIDFYRARFANAADFTFVMVGAFKVDEALPLVAQYVGSLPSTGARSSAFRDVGLCFPKTVQREQIEKGREPRGQAVISFFANPSSDPDEQEVLSEAVAVLQTSLRDILREALGQTYSVSVGFSQPLPQPGYGRIEVSFGAAPENLASMTDRVLKEIERLQAEGPSADLTSRAKEAARRNFEVALKQNGYWLRRLAAAKLLGQDPADIPRRAERIDKVTPESLREAFRRYFPMDRYTAVTLVPQAAP